MARADRVGGTPPDGARPPEPDTRGAWVWPVGIIVALLLVVAVNVGFMVVALQGADEIVESYTTEER